MFFIEEMMSLWGNSFNEHSNHLSELYSYANEDQGLAQSHINVNSKA